MPYHVGLQASYGVYTTAPFYLKREVADLVIMTLAPIQQQHNALTDDCAELAAQL
jgi:hypothetical protein